MSDEVADAPPPEEAPAVEAEAPLPEEAAAPAAEAEAPASEENAPPPAEGGEGGDGGEAAPASEEAPAAEAAPEPAADADPEAAQTEGEVPEAGDGGEAPQEEAAAPADGVNEEAPKEGEGEAAAEDPEAGAAAPEGGEAAGEEAPESGDAPATAEGGGEGEGEGADPNMEKAAIKIQAAQRGVADRKAVSDAKERGELPGQKKAGKGAVPEDSAAGDVASFQSVGGKSEVEAMGTSEAAHHAFQQQQGMGGGLSGVRELEVDMGRELPPVRITLEISSEVKRKPFFGGFRHKITGTEYHNAVCQTEAPPKPQRSPEDLAPPKFHRDTQTKKTKEKALQSLREHGTQMPRDDHYEDVRGDYVIEARPYLDSEQWGRIRYRACLVIQCYTRGMFARSLARRFKAELEYNRKYYQEVTKRQGKEMEATREREIDRRMNPKSAKDFEILYKELEAWRVSETQRIEIQDVTPAEKQVARYQLLLKEVKLVQTIDKLKSSAKKENDADAVTKLLNEMSQPKLWEMSDGAVKEVQTPYTIRAKELSDLYQGMSLSNLRVDERLDVLLHVKWTVKEFDTKVTRDLVELIDREADLLNRGRGDKALEGLRKRTLRCFLQFVQNPMYNPEAANFPLAKKL